MMSTPAMQSVHASLAVLAGMRGQGRAGGWGQKWFERLTMPGEAEARSDRGEQESGDGERSAALVGAAKGS